MNSQGRKILFGPKRKGRLDIDKSKVKSVFPAKGAH